jgi:hypothetical protein
MANTHRSALGRQIDIDKLRLSNEDTIAVGNMKVNARGDQLGPGGEVVRTRNQIMNDYYQLNTPTVTLAENELAADESVLIQKAPVPPAVRAGSLRGSLADSIAKDGK